MKAQFIIDFLEKIYSKIYGTVSNELGALDIEKSVIRNLGTFVIGASVLLIGIVFTLVLIYL